MLKYRPFRVFLRIAGFISAMLLILIIYLLSVSTVSPPKPNDLSSLQLKKIEIDSGLYAIGRNWFRKSNSGLYELYVEGKPFERGVINGKLTEDLVRYQEEVFTQQIHRLVPNNAWLEFLKYFVGWFNRNLDDDVNEEYKLEIYGVSQSASHDFDDIAPPFQRLLNYHAAHDIGHALQNMSFVGCTSFAVWGDKSKDSTLLIGRNFDFYVGEDFARDKIVAFYNPDHGYKFMMITWGGMTGVLSGMNEEGLTVTINAAKSEIPIGSATPVSLVAREILQYAKDIKQAREIAAKRQMFVSESFLIGSAYDHKAAIIEKSENGMGYFESDSNQIICTNHFQSKELGNTPINQEHMRTSPSVYRYKRVQELLSRDSSLNYLDVAHILRDQRGLHDEDIGLGNEKAINQLIAHHSVIFQPERLRVWVSTSPYQLGEYVCYDLNFVFSHTLNRNVEIYNSTYTIPSDPFLKTKAFSNYQKFVQYRFPFSDRSTMNPDSLIRWNPNSYLSYMLAGDYAFRQKQFEKAGNFYSIGLQKEVASVQEKEYMEHQATVCKEKLQ